MKFIEELARLAQDAFSNIDIGNQLEQIISGNKAINVVTNNVLKGNSATPVADPETGPTTITLAPDPKNRIPVLYGRGITKGTITDVALGANGLDLWLCYVLSETTGSTIDGDPSVISFKKIFMNGYEMEFAADGVTATLIKDVESPPNEDTSIAGLIQVFCYNNGSANQTWPTGYSGTAANATTRFPAWNANYEFNNLVFALVKVTFNATAELTSLPEFSFDLENSMNQPGDVLRDYMTNTRYGAGIAEAEINVG